ncbi:MAG: hypothetical protein M1570_08515 [Chloroflexi bacterium]|nr:hypothetical protein [Chloroflexota bacterium]
MKNVRVFVVGMAVLAILALGPWNAAAQSGRPAPVPLSLHEAYQTGLKTASRWDSSAKLYELNSTDSGEDPALPEDKRGLGGRRVSWNLDFVVPGTDRHLYLEVRGGQVVNQTALRGPLGDSSFEADEVMGIRADEAVARSKELQPGRKWATGYQYRLFKDAADAILVIRGRDSQGAGKAYTGVAVRPGDAAVKCQSDNCDNQPVVPYGTYLYLKSYSVPIPDGSTNPAHTDYYSTLMVNDKGAGTDDPYWVDVYFGRWKFASDTCHCDGVADPPVGYCVNGYTNSCSNTYVVTGHHSYYYNVWVE